MRRALSHTLQLALALSIKQRSKRCLMLRTKTPTSSFATSTSRKLSAAKMLIGANGCRDRDIPNCLGLIRTTCSCRLGSCSLSLTSPLRFETPPSSIVLL